MRTFLLFFVFSACLLPATALQPVVLINGLAGSNLNARLNGAKEPHVFCDKKKDWFRIWLTVEELVPGVVDCFFHNVVVHFNNQTKQYEDTEGVDIDGNVGWGSTKGLDYLDPSLKAGKYFHDIIKRLESIGYVDNKSLRGAPYDWRLSARGLDSKPTFSGNNNLPYFAKLKALIEDTSVTNGGEKIHIISHSMGGPVSLAFLHRQSTDWKDKYIASLIAVSPPFGGSVKTVKAVVSGDNFDAPVVHQNIFWPVQSTCASGPWLFPQDGLWRSDEVLVETPSKNYTSADWLQLFSDMPGLSSVKLMSEETDILTNTLGEKEFVAPNVKVALIRGTDVKTEIGYTYGVDFNSSGKGKSAPPPTAIRTDNFGDGTVPNRSLARALQWQGQQPQPVTYNVFPGASHEGILSDSNAIDRIVEYVTGVL